MTDAPRFPSGTSFLLVSTLLLFAAPALLFPATAQAQRSADFLFRAPSVSITVRAGGWIPRAESEIFDFTREQLTVERRDFRAIFVGVDAAYRWSDRIDVAFSLDLIDSETDSEFRDWIGEDDLPITQTTSLRVVPVQLGLKVYLRERGRAIGNHAWIPDRWVPYVGGGVGATWYTFEQQGEFVDFTDLLIFEDHFDSKGTAASVHLRGGMDVTLTPRFFLNADARYIWGGAELGRDFVGFDEIDLTGLQATLGVGVRL